MNVHKETNIDLSQFSTLQLGGTGEVFYRVDQPHELPDVFTEIQSVGLDWHIMGQGSNSVFTDGHHQKTFVQLNNQEFTVDGGLVTAGAGMIWDDLVQKAVEHGLQGIEALSAIPGTVGAAPVQNIGAYGAELSQVCEAVEVFDTETKTFHKLDQKGCQFAYRDSLFKHDTGKHLIVTRVMLRLRQNLQPPIPQYPGVQDMLDEYAIVQPTLGDIRRIIAMIRWGKLPKPEELPNCGSFFKNPVFSAEQGETMRATHPEMPLYDTADGQKKSSAGWMIDQCGLKGYRHGNMGIYEKHALIIVNHGGGTFTEFQELVQHIQDCVQEKFGIQLEPEVRIFTS